MGFQDIPIRRKLMAVMLLTSGAVLLLTCLAFIGYEFFSFRTIAVRSLGTIAKLVATNSTAALAFENPADATEVLAALKAEPHMSAAALYDANGSLFARYPADAPDRIFPTLPDGSGYRFEHSHLIDIEGVRQGANRSLGLLYLNLDLQPLYGQIALYSLIAVAMTGVAFLVACVISRVLQEQISRPIRALAQTASAIAEKNDYSVRARKLGTDELGSLTDVFNHMLGQIQQRDESVREAQGKSQAQLARLDLLHGITRAIGHRQDLRSIFQVVIRRLEDNLPIDFGCICLHEPAEQFLTVASVGDRSRAHASELALAAQARIPIDENGLGRCVRGELVYEPDIAESRFALPRTLAHGGLHSFVVAPLLSESRVFGVLIAARAQANGFGSGDCEFLRQLSEHVALAAHQVQLYAMLQKSYDDLRQTQQAVLQQERLRALGQIASGVAHDINNAISPASLYVESILERETGLSDRARGHLTTVQVAIDGVAQTVSRMREFYRPREPQHVASSIHLDQTIREVIDITRVRWRDLPQEHGVVIELRTELQPHLPAIRGAQNEVRDALTNLIFNAIDAMPDGGVITLRTRLESGRARVSPEHAGDSIVVEVSDTGIGMDEETRRRCLEPFFTTKGERGTGMGLAMVYGMAERHNAELEIDSEPRKGTTMRLIFPVAPAATDASGIQHALVPPTQSLRILIVDDDPLIIESLRETLRADGHRVTATDGGQAGIDAFAAAHREGSAFALVITDLGMPYVDGRRVAAAVKAISSETPIVLLTGWGQRLSADSEVPAHVDRVLTKPPRLRDLRSVLAELRPRIVDCEGGQVGASENG